MPLSRLQLAQELIDEYAEFLPVLPADEARRVGGEQEIIARYEPDRAVKALSVLLANRKDRTRLLTLLNRVLADERVQRVEPSDQQKGMLARIRAVLGSVERGPAEVGIGRRATASGQATARTRKVQVRGAVHRARKLT